MVATYTEGDEPVPGFRLICLLGWGRFGEVWKASAPGGFEAAVKFINLGNAHGLKEFRAIRLFKQIRHPNLVPLMALWLKDKQGHFIDDAVVEDATSLQAQAAELIIAMGVGDKSLYDRLKECREELGLPGIPADELLNYMDQVACALDFLNQPAHDFGAGLVAIQHCDIKPHNILIVGTAAQVCDLGVARVLQDPRATAAMGSAAYIAPECIQVGRPSSATDQYSLAISYVEMRTGGLPFEAKTVAAAYMAHLHGRHNFSRLSPGEQDALRRATAVNPEERFPSCRALVRALREATQDGQAVLAATPLPRASAFSCTDSLSALALSRESRNPGSVLDDTERPVLKRMRVTLRVPAARVLAAGETDPDIRLPAAGEREPAPFWDSNALREPARLVPDQQPAVPAAAHAWTVATQPGKPSRLRSAWIMLSLLIVLPGIVVVARLFSTSSAAPLEPQETPVAEHVEPSPQPMETVSPNDPLQPVAPPTAPTVERAQGMPEILREAKEHAARSEYQPAVAAYTALLRQKPQLVEAFTGRAAAYLELGRYEEAVADATAAIKLDGRDPATYALRASAKIRQGDSNGAIEDCNVGLSLNRGFAEAFFTRGSAYSQKHLNDRALADYNQAIKLNPKDGRAWHERTHACMALGVVKLNQAIAEYGEEIRKDPRNVFALAERGHANLHRGRLDLALADCNAVLQLAPGYALAYSVRGECYRQKGKKEQAIQDCTEAVRLDPRCVTAYLSRGVAYLDLGSAYDQAIADFNRVLLINPQFWDAYLKRGEAYAIEGKYELSRADYERARKGNARSTP